MAELRLDPVTHRWVVTGKRPLMPDVIDTGAMCPFCPGNEHLTPKAIEQILGPDGKWMLRVFHDRAPAFRVEGNLDRRGAHHLRKLRLWIWRQGETWFEAWNSSQPQLINA